MEELSQSGENHVSSTQIAKRLHLSDAQIRKDLSYFGKFGVRGKGYDVEALSDKIQEILGTTSTWSCVIVGTGNLGQALLAYEGFRKHNFEILAAFDVDESIVGTRINNCPVHHMDRMEELLAEHDVRLAIIAVPAEQAQEVLDRLVRIGVKGILNFAPFVPEAPDDVIIESVDLSTNLEVLTYFLSHQNGSET